MSCGGPRQRGRLLLRSIDRLIFVGLYRLFPDVRGALAIVKPGTVIRWHRAAFRAYWRWKSRTRGGRPKVPPEIRQLIRDMSLANPLWGAPRIHGELLKLGIYVGQTSVAKYMARRRRPPSQGWTTLLRNHADGIIAMDLFAAPSARAAVVHEILQRGAHTLSALRDRHPPEVSCGRRQCRRPPNDAKSRPVRPGHRREGQTRGFLPAHAPLEWRGYVFAVAGKTPRESRQSEKALDLSRMDRVPHSIAYPAPQHM
jgi:hypothetical protein